MVSSFTVLNLFIAIVVDSMQTLHDEEAERTTQAIATVVDADTRIVSREIDSLREEIRALRGLLEERRP